MSTLNLVPSIEDFYEGRSILITGASGFIGKQLLEKLLRSCPRLKSVYVLLRSNKHHSAKDRLQHLLNSALFSRVKEDQTDVGTKIHVIEGNIEAPNFGISDADQQKLINNVSIVFHLAATVSFNEPLRVAVTLNILGLRRLLELCKKLGKLEACVHVSTAYANCDKDFIEEKVYPPPIMPDKILDAIEWMSDDIFQEITPKITVNHPNTYTFTKSIAEQLLVDERESLPVAILRPSIVTASNKEPIPGWVDNLNGATGVFTAVGSGFLNGVYGTSNCVADFIPVDLVANAIIAVAWKTATNRPKDVPVYNCTSGNLNPINWGQVAKLISDLVQRYPVENPTWIPKTFVTENRFFSNFSNIEIYSRLFGIDMLRRLFGKKPRLLRIHRNVCKMMKLMEYFTTHEWKWSNDNLMQLHRSMSDHDKQVFNFDSRLIHWSSYFEAYCLGIRQYTMHQDMKSLPKAREFVYRMMETDGEELMWGAISELKEAVVVPTGLHRGQFHVVLPFGDIPSGDGIASMEVHDVHGHYVPSKDAQDNALLKLAQEILK